MTATMCVFTGRSPTVHVSIREQTMMFSIYSFKPQCEKIVPHILVLIFCLAEIKKMHEKRNLK